MECGLDVGQGTGGGSTLNSAPAPWGRPSPQPQQQPSFGFMTPQQPGQYRSRTPTPTSSGMAYVPLPTRGASVSPTRAPAPSSFAPYQPSQKSPQPKPILKTKVPSGPSSAEAGHSKSVKFVAEDYVAGDFDDQEKVIIVPQTFEGKLKFFEAWDQCQSECGSNKTSGSMSSNRYAPYGRSSSPGVGGAGGTNKLSQQQQRQQQQSINNLNASLYNQSSNQSAGGAGSQYYIAETGNIHHREFTDPAFLDVDVASASASSSSYYSRDCYDQYDVSLSTSNLLVV